MAEFLGQWSLGLEYRHTPAIAVWQLESGFFGCVNLLDGTSLYCGKN
jgi:hypothetical protein